MISSGLRPTDPARWYLAFAVERAIEQEDRDAQQATQGGQQDIEVLDNGADTQ